MKKKRGFNLRSFTSFSLLISTIIMAWSGIILYIAPAGRIAKWGGWKLMLFTKDEWQALHTIFSYMFFILFVIHLFFVNWKAFLTYFKSKTRSGLNRKWELLAAIIISVIFFVGTLRSWVPFGPVMDFGEKVKESWETRYSGPEIAHMEEFTLEKLATTFSEVTADDLLNTLRDSGVTVSGTSVPLKRIAADNRVTPARVHEILVRRYQPNVKAMRQEAPSGVGRMTLGMAASRMEKDTEELITLLKEYGVEADSGTNMRVIADRLGISPPEAYALLSGEK